jgi:molybdopterin molybdotransferase
MITQQEAYATMMAQVRTLSSEQIDLDQALHRVLAEDVRADMDMPPFIKSAMDGYACRRDDLGNQLQVVETVKAGTAPEKIIGDNQCTKIMTGGMVPEGADCVIIVEDTEEIDDRTIRFTASTTRDNICQKGEDMQVGDIVLTAGTRLGPQQIAMAASVGCVSPCVARQPRVGIISTGDELVEPDVKPNISQIRTSNSHQLVAQVWRADAIPTYYGIARDNVESIDATLKQAMKENDVVLLSGGVSMGEFDLVPGIMKSNGFEILFDEIAIQPGKPTTFAVAPDAYCVGLPGSPVATFSQFEQLVKPFLYRLMGHEYRPPNIFLPMANAHSRPRARREGWFPARISDEGTVTPCEFHGSAHVDALCEADCLATMPPGVAELDAGSPVRVLLLNP